MLVRFVRTKFVFVCDLCVLGDTKFYGEFRLLWLLNEVVSL